MIAVPQTPLDRWLPKLVLCLRQYNLHFFTNDVIAGLTVGLVALPWQWLSASPPVSHHRQEFIRQSSPGFLISALGGPAPRLADHGAFVVIVAGIVAKFGLSGLFIVTMMAGDPSGGDGSDGIGNGSQVHSRPVTIGFTNGIAVLIASTQIRDFLGLNAGDVPSEFIGRMRVLFSHLNPVDPRTAVVAGSSLATSCYGQSLPSASGFHRGRF